jgi:hypothetical protein
MGFIREPIEGDFTFMSKTWTTEEEKEFSELIMRQKNERQRKITNIFKVKSEILVPALI